jgi:Arc/MetJ-type ribon-helix-helix transcriptional regulator
MKVELTSDTTDWVRDVMAAGRFSSAEDAIRYAVDRAKLSELRAELEAAEAEGGAFESNEVKRFALSRLDRDKPTPDR